MTGEMCTGWLRQHRALLVVVLASLCGAATVFAFGFLIGRLTEPVPEMPGGIHALAWLLLPLLVGTGVVPLASLPHTSPHASRFPVGSEGLALVQHMTSPLTEQEHSRPATDICDLDAALGQFPQERPMSSAGSLRPAPAEVFRVA